MAAMPVYSMAVLPLAQKTLANPMPTRKDVAESVFTITRFCLFLGTHIPPMSMAIAAGMPAGFTERKLLMTWASIGPSTLLSLNS